MVQYNWMLVFSIYTVPALQILWWTNALMSNIILKLIEFHCCRHLKSWQLYWYCKGSSHMFLPDQWPELVCYWQWNLHQGMCFCLIYEGMLTSTVGAQAPYILTNMRNILKLFSNTSSCMKNEDFWIRNSQLNIVSSMNSETYRTNLVVKPTTSSCQLNSRWFWQCACHKN